MPSRVDRRGTHGGAPRLKAVATAILWAACMLFILGVSWGALIVAAVKAAIGPHGM